MTVEFELNGQPFVALNGGPGHPFSDAISFYVLCETQEEIDRYWDALAESGEEGPCGWLKDKFGLSWQITPTVLMRLMATRTREGAARHGRNARDEEDRHRRARAGRGESRRLRVTRTP